MKDRQILQGHSFQNKGEVTDGGRLGEPSAMADVRVKVMRR